MSEHQLRVLLSLIGHTRSLYHMLIQNKEGTSYTMELEVGTVGTNRQLSAKAICQMV